ncbi:hypothetical protein BX666DRAFT_1934876 [Dichotomocladium elegans]|nr:hypothetical protein BX666DRAFT_1934876 [Dichotomocladium elegans]
MAVVTRPSSPVFSSTPSSTKPKTTKSRKRTTKPHVSAACVNCQRAHLACDMGRPCRRCVQSGREDTCMDVQHKKRGRPRRDRKPFFAQSNNPCGLTNFMAPPELLYSSFTMTEQADRRATASHCSKEDRGIVKKHMVTLFLSMDVCCARVSDESLNLLGLYPHEFAHRTLYDFIHPDHTKHLARAHRRLLENANSTSGEKCIPPTQRTTADCFTHTPATQLLSIANGSQTLRETLGFRTSDGSFMMMDARFYLGGGLGADLFVPDTLEHLYIVCLATAEADSPPAATHARARASAADMTKTETPLTSFFANQSSPSPTLVAQSCVSVHFWSGSFEVLIIILYAVGSKPPKPQVRSAAPH